MDNTIAPEYGGLRDLVAVRQEYGTSLLNTNVQDALQYMCLKNPQQHIPTTKEPEPGTRSCRMDIWNSSIPSRAKALLAALMKFSPAIQERCVLFIPEYDTLRTLAFLVLGAVKYLMLYVGMALSLWLCLY